MGIRSWATGAAAKGSQDCTLFEDSYRIAAAGAPVGADGTYVTTDDLIANSNEHLAQTVDGYGRKTDGGRWRNPARQPDIYDYDFKPRK